MCITEPFAGLRRRQAGFSMVEMLMAMIIVSVGVVALLIPITSITRNSADPLVTKQMIAIAEGMLEEIELKPFATPTGGFAGASTCANRSQFDAVPDYNNFTTAGAGICDINGVPIATLSSYNLSVTTALTAMNGGAIAAGNAYLISVTVTGPNGSSVTLSGFRTSYF
jgi:MSHA pilin protein MshD